MTNTVEADLDYFSWESNVCNCGTSASSMFTDMGKTETRLCEIASTTTGSQDTESCNLVSHFDLILKSLYLYKFVRTLQIGA